MDTNSDKTNNYKASRGWELDAIHQIMSCCALTSHLLEKLHEYQHNGEEDKMDDVIELIQLATGIRRQAVATLKPDTTFSCALKHACEIYQYSLECTLATDSYPYELTYKSYELLVGVVSKALGYELEFCGRCFWDQRMIDNKSKQDTIEPAE